MSPCIHTLVDGRSLLRLILSKLYERVLTSRSLLEQFALMIYLTITTRTVLYFALPGRRTDFDTRADRSMGMTDFQDSNVFFYVFKRKIRNYICSKERRNCCLTRFASLTLLRLRGRTKRLPGTIAQDDADCEGVSVSGLLDADGFPPEGAVYSNTVDEEATRGEYVNSDESFFIW